MKAQLLIICLAIATQSVHAQTKSDSYPDFDRALVLEVKPDTTANVSFGDLNRDGHLDILLVKGRHWPIVDVVLLGDGKGQVSSVYNLGTVADRSYTGALADFNGDSFLDVAVSNDKPDAKVIYFNDGKGNFERGPEFGLRQWPTRNLSIADINRDGAPDIILANRGESSNSICLNDGKGNFGTECISFAPYSATSIFPADLNKDGFVDLVVPHRDGGRSYVYFGSSDNTYSDDHRVTFGPSDATIRMAATADFNGDGIFDIVSVDEDKGVYLYLGQTNKSFSSGVSLANAKVVPYALAVADLNGDEKPDIIVGHKKAPSKVFFNDGTGRSFKKVSFGDSRGTVYGFAIGDFNEDGVLDIAAARSDGPNVLYFGNVKK